MEHIHRNYSITIDYNQSSFYGATGKVKSSMVPFVIFSGELVCPLQNC